MNNIILFAVLQNINKKLFDIYKLYAYITYINLYIIDKGNA